MAGTLQALQGQGMRAALHVKAGDGIVRNREYQSSQSPLARAICVLPAGATGPGWPRGSLVAFPCRRSSGRSPKKQPTSSSSTPSMAWCQARLLLSMALLPTAFWLQSINVGRDAFVPVPYLIYITIPHLHYNPSLRKIPAFARQRQISVEGPPPS